jgi:hypothetical protein
MPAYHHNESILNASYIIQMQDQERYTAARALSKFVFYSRKSPTSRFRSDCLNLINLILLSARDGGVAPYGYLHDLTYNFRPQENFPKTLLQLVKDFNIEYDKSYSVSERLTKEEQQALLSLIKPEYLMNTNK